jgi:3-deoxy-manno-octulosonate cytidylyltransferase (CMP-KDO synthetase)
MTSSELSAPPRAVAIIPARHDARRLPGKPLVDIEGLPMVVRVMRRVEEARSIGRVIVATDDVRIAKAVREHGGEVCLTSPEHRSGTDRVAEAARILALDADVIVNVQGDEPLLEPTTIDSLVAAMVGGVDVATCCTPLDGDAADPNRVKVVRGAGGRALYFSRMPVPHGGPYLLHLGLYAFTPPALQAFTALAPTALEKSERLEQLRLLDHGWKIHLVHVASHAISVDTPEDLAQVRAWIRGSQRQRLPSAR